MSQSIFSYLYFFDPLRHELLIWFHLELSQEQCPEWSEDVSIHPNPILSSLLFPSSLIYSRKDTPTHTLSPSLPPSTPASLLRPQIADLVKRRGAVMEATCLGNQLKAEDRQAPSLQ